MGKKPCVMFYVSCFIWGFNVFDHKQIIKRKSVLKGTLLGYEIPGLAYPTSPNNP